MRSVVLEEQRTVGRRRAAGFGVACGNHLVATSNLSLTRVTLQALAPCFFLSISQSSDVSRRGTGGFLEPEVWPGAGVRTKRKHRQLLSSSVFSQPVCSDSVLTLSLPRSTHTHQPCSGLSLRTAGLDCSELWPGQWPWSPVEERTVHPFGSD